MALIQCPTCGEWNDPNSSDSCVHCKSPLMEGQDIQDEFDRTKSGWYEDPEGSGGLRWYDAKTEKWSDRVSQAADVKIEANTQEDSVSTSSSSSLLEEWESRPSEIEGLPVLENWKTSYGFSVLGVVAYGIVFFSLVFVFSLFVELAIGPYPYVGAFAGACIAMIMNILGIIYANCFYSSYFKEKPLIRNNNAISFFNLFFGNVVFGCLWNSNLTRSNRAQKEKMGYSAIVFCMLAAISLLVGIANIVTVELPYISAYQQYYAQKVNDDTSSSSNATSGVKRVDVDEAFPERFFSDSADGVSFTVPSGWYCGDSDLSSGGQRASCLLYPIQKQKNINAMVFVQDGISNKTFNALSASDIRESLPSGMENWSEEEVAKVDLGGHSYWLMMGTGTMSSSDGGTEVHAGYWYTSQNGKLYSFVFMDTLNTSESSQYLYDFRKLIESATYN